MAKRDSRNTRGRIINAAWALFYEQGYEDTTIEEIIEQSGSTRNCGRFCRPKCTPSTS